jgi:hypothetical protein
MKESTIHLQVCHYLQRQYPKIIFRTDFAAGIKMTMAQAIKHRNLQSGRAYPDLFIAEPRAGAHGLFIELKKDGTKLTRTKDAKQINKGDYKIRKIGDWFDPHIEEQAEMLALLSAKGYVAMFGIGFDAAKDIIDKYLDDQK